MDILPIIADGKRKAKGLQASKKYDIILIEK
jgi:hypothetical protein